MALDGLPHNNVLGDDGSRGDVVYEIDGEDRLISVNEPWSHFARANHAAYLADSSILERSLWEFIADRETRMIYGMLFERVRSEGKSLYFNFRCDTPTMRRWMQMRLIGGSGGKIRFVSSVLDEEERDYVPLIDPLVPHSQEFLVICGWCKRVEMADGTWLEVEFALEVLQLFEVPRLPQLSHGICPVCLVDFTSWRSIHRAD